MLYFMNKTPEKTIAELESIVTLMDSDFSIAGFRFGLDGIIGLVPGLGDSAGGFISLYIVLKAYRAGVSSETVSKMLLYILIDVLLGSIPLLGDIFDFFFKVNEKNLELVKRELLI